MWEFLEAMLVADNDVCSLTLRKEINISNLLTSMNNNSRKYL